MPSMEASFTRHRRESSAQELRSPMLQETCTSRKNSGLIVSRRPSFRREVKTRNVDTINFQSASTGLAPVRELNSRRLARRAAGARGRLRRHRRREHGRSRAWRRPARAEPTHKPRHWCASRCLREPSRGRQSWLRPRVRRTKASVSSSNISLRKRRRERLGSHLRSVHACAGSAVLIERTFSSLHEAVAMR
jgi:hypothetical protein